MGDTWGISGPTFLLLYAALLGLAIVAGVVLRRSALRAARGELRLDERDPYLLAYLGGGPVRTVQAALVRLRLLDVLAPNAEAGRWAVVGSLTDEPSALELAVIEAARAGCNSAQIAGDPRVRAALADLEGRAEGSGAIAPVAAVRQARRGAWPVLVVLALGLARLVAGASAGKPVLFLLMALVLTGAIAVALLVVPRPHPSLAADLTALRSRYGTRPTGEVGVPELALASAFGVAMLGGAGIAGWGLLGPQEQEHLALARQAGASSSGWSGTDGLSGGGSGSGDYGGGDSGGSSGCGGGGCGGGGCGG
jgi:uncharacterized protein (TIGR04222 family)